MISYETHYRKGFPSQKLWERYVPAVAAADANEIEDIVDAQVRESGATTKIATDPDVYSLKSPYKQLMNNCPEPPALDSAEFKKHLDFTREIAGIRDTRLEDVPTTIAGLDVPIGLRKLSWFLEDYQVPAYTPGVDYMTTADTYHPVQNGMLPSVTQQSNGFKTIETLRDGAAMVRKDDPFAIYGQVINRLLSLGVETRPREGSVRSKNIDHFAIGGNPSIKSCVFESANAFMPLSFGFKYKFWYPRPEQAYFDKYGEFLPQAYDRGSPYHCSYLAMHGAMYYVNSEMLKNIFDKYHILPNGNTVEDELGLLYENGAHFRTAAGVHYLFDNTNGNLVWDEIANNLCHKYFAS